MAASIQRHFITQGDLSPLIQFNVTRESTGLPYDLASVTSVKFSMTQKGQKTAKVDAAATVYDAAGGIIRYQWQTGDTDTPGDFEGQVHLIDAGGKATSFPNGAYVEIKVLARR